MSSDLAYAVHNLSRFTLPQPRKGSFLPASGSLERVRSGPQCASGGPGSCPQFRGIRTDLSHEVATHDSHIGYQPARKPGFVRPT
jgi:hypothetical protein